MQAICNTIMRMKNFIYIFTCLVVAFIPMSSCYAQDWHYEIECAGTGVQGTYLVEVTSYGKTVDAALAQMKKDAVHGVLFSGLSGQCVQKPLAGSAEVENEHKDFFDNFFSTSGDYSKYVVEEKNMNIIAKKVGKREYKVTKVISVKKDLLRRDLEKAGVIKALGL